jgi:hypothetical protein
MGRRDETAASGWVKWPTHSEDWKSTGEGGMWVYAVIPPKDENCCVETIGLGPCDVHFGCDLPHVPYPEDSPQHILSSAVFMGSTGGSWWNESEETYFQATESDLTDEGRALLDMLEKLSGTRPILWTFLDT